MNYVILVRYFDEQGRATRGEAGHFEHAHEAVERMRELWIGATLGPGQGLAVQEVDTGWVVSERCTFDCPRGWADDRPEVEKVLDEMEARLEDYAQDHRGTAEELVQLTMDYSLELHGHLTRAERSLLRKRLLEAVD